MGSTGGRRVRRGRVLTLGATALALLLGGTGCAAEEQAPKTAEHHPGGDGAEAAAQQNQPGAAANPCPAGLTGDRLGRTRHLGSADVDGDGTADEVVMAEVLGGGARCKVAVVVTTASGISAAPVQDASTLPVEGVLDRPVFVQLDGEAGDEIVTGTSWHPRGGGEVSMFSWVEGGLVQVQQGNRPWTVFATIDDAGGTPQLFVCSDRGFTQVAAFPPGSDRGATVTRYALTDGVVDVLDVANSPQATWSGVRSDYPQLPPAGLKMFPACG